MVKLQANGNLNLGGEALNTFGDVQIGGSISLIAGGNWLLTTIL